MPSCGSPSLKTHDEWGIRKDSRALLDSLKQGTCSSWGDCLYFPALHVARIDDTAKFREVALAAYPLIPEFGVITKLPWSKNVYGECDAPPQVLFDAMDPCYDVHSNLGIWLGYHYKLNQGVNEFIFGYQGLDDPIRIKERISKLLIDLIEGK